MKAYHICHHNDEDGLASAAVIYEYLKQVNKKNKVKYFFYEIDYTMKLNKVLNENIPAGDEIYFVDYSFSTKYNLDYILKLSNENDIRVTWIDHHKTSYDIVYNNAYGIDFYEYPKFYYLINTKYCGAYLSYVYANSRLGCYVPTNDILVPLGYGEYVPLYIRYVNSWDTWKHDMPNTIEFDAGLRTAKRTPKNVFSSIFGYNKAICDKLFSDYEEDIEIVESYMEKYIKDIIYKGRIIKKYNDNNNESLCKNAGFAFNIVDQSDGQSRVYKCFALNKRGNSTMFGDRVNTYDILVPFRFNGNEYVYSLYTAKDDVNCEVLAKKLGSIDGLGGGGHTKAAGFQAYNQLIKENCNLYIHNKFFNKKKYRIFTQDVKNKN